MSQLSRKKILLTGEQKPFLGRTESLTRLYNEIRPCRTLSNEETMNLIKTYREGNEEESNESLEKLCRHNLRLVVSMARKFCTQNDNLMDLISEGCIGFIKAINKFDFKRSSKLQAFAMIHMRKTINDFKTEHSPIVQQTNRSKTTHIVNRIVSELTQLYERMPTSDEVLDEYNKRNPTKKISSTEDIVNVEYVYIDAIEPVTGEINETSIEYNRSTASYNSVLGIIEKEHKRELIKSFMSILTFREKQIVSLMYGLKDGVEVGADIVSDITGLSPERVRQICRTAVHKMSRKAEKYAYAR